jgi:uncharacterized membrane protein HdeD (DUF308 family)
MSETHQLRENWGWMMLFGCLMVVLGIFAVAYAAVFTVVSVLWTAWILIIAGVVEAVHAIRHHEQGHLVWYILEALLSIVVGALLLRGPILGAVVLTLLLATYFLVAGIFRIVAATVLHLPGRGWVLFNGVVTLALGIVVWGGWPASSFWVIGLFIGITLILSGFARIMLALALRGSDLHHPMTA